MVSYICFFSNQILCLNVKKSTSYKLPLSCLTANINAIPLIISKNQCKLEILRHLYTELNHDIKLENSDQKNSFMKNNK